MDYDDNEFESRNPQLKGEGSTDFSPILRPYTLPKYDFDDSLREHLRFDNLVESEAFLGIESQEDNQWIEDFSQGGTQIEFSSSGAASCAILRRSDVWSEATSLESFEMLLKSVGQEEMIPGQIIIDESEASANLDSSSKETGTVLKEDACIISRVEDVKDLGMPLPAPEIILSSSSGLKEDSGRFLQVQDSFHASEGDESSLVNLRNVDSCDVLECCSAAVDGNDLKDGKLNDVNQSETLNCSMLEDSSTFKMQCDNVISAQATCTRGADSNTEQAIHQTNYSSDENEVCIEKDNVGDMEVHSNCKDAEMDDQNMLADTSSNEVYNTEKPFIVAPQNKSVGEIKIVGTSQSDTHTSCSMTGNSDFQTLEGSFASPSPLIPGQGTIGEDSHARAHFNENQKSPVSLQGDCDAGVYAGKTKNCTTCIGANIDMKLSSVAQINDEQGVESDRTVYPEDCGNKVELVSVCRYDGLVLSVQDSKYLESQCEQISNSQMMETSISKVVPSSCELENEMTINLQSVPAASFDSGDLNGEHHDLLETSKLREEHGMPGQGDDADYHMQGHGRVEDEVGGCQAPSSTTAGNRYDSNDSMKNTDCTLNNALGGCSLLEFVEPKAHDKSISAIEEFTVIDSKEEFASKINVQAGLSIPNEDSEVVDEIGSVSKSELDASHNTEVDSSKEELRQAEITDKSNLGKVSEPHEAVADKASGELFNMQEDQHVSYSSSVNDDLVDEIGHVTQSELDACHDTEVDSSKEELKQAEIAETSNSGYGSEPHESITDKASGEFSNGLEAQHVSCRSSVNEDLVDLVAAVAPKRCEEEPVKEIHEEAMSKVLDKPTSSSPSIICSVDVCKQGTKIEEGDKGPLDQHATLTDAIGGDAKKDCVVLEDIKDTVSKEQMEFSFDIRPLADVDKGEAERSWKQLSTMQSFTKIVEKASTVSSLGYGDSIKVKEISHTISQSLNTEIKFNGPKGTPERKTRRAPGKGKNKDSAKMGNNVKVSTPTRHFEQVEKSSSTSLGSNLARQLVPSKGSHLSGHVGQHNTNRANVLSTPTSSLPDLNTSAAVAAVFQPPFSGSQQVQLRAQIFVYGSLIQGTPPEEACMMSAFGDGGRGIWEKAWRPSVERFMDQKCNTSNQDTPLKLLSGTKSPDHTNKQDLIQSNTIFSSTGRANSKNTPSPVLNSTLPLSSPLWSIPTPVEAMQSSNIPRNTMMSSNQGPSPLHSYPPPSVRNFGGHSWVPHSPFAGPWLSTSQVSPFGSNIQFPFLAITEAVKSTPVRESSGPPAPCPQYLFTSPVLHREGLNNVYPVASVVSDLTKKVVSPVQDLSNPKSGKRKKSASEDLSRISFPLQAVTYPAAFSVNSPFSSPVVAAPTHMPKIAEEKAVIVATTSASSDRHTIRHREVEQRNLLSDESLSNIKEAKLQAEYAHTRADIAVNHSQVVWDELDKHKKSGLNGDREAKLASAAVAIAAAASVAKAAAAAAKVAAAAALQAKLMAEEAVFPSGTGTSSQNSVTPLSSAVSIFGDVTPASTLNGQDGKESSGSILIAAREAARIRVEAASAASVRAENLDAIVKAAELAAEAVTQAGKVVSMGNHLSLVELAKAGPKGYWKVPSHFALTSENSKTMEAAVQSELVEDECIEHNDRQTSSTIKPPSSREQSMVSVEDPVRLVDGSSPLLTNKQSGNRRKDSKNFIIRDTAVLPEPNIELTNTLIPVHKDQEKTVITMDGKCIKEGSLVEILKDDDSSKAAWHLASVLSWKDGEIFVCYAETSSNKGEGQLREWISLNGQGDSAPRIRIPHPMTSIHFEGSKKRCREAMVNYTWSVGDKVDACINDCWWEGVVTEKHKKDDTTLTVHFPAQDKTTAVRAWQLRPSVFWMDGQWLEWSKISWNDHPLHEGFDTNPPINSDAQGDTPREKRRKIGGQAIESKEKEWVSTDIGMVDSTVTQGAPLLDLGTNEKIFNIGKDEGNKPESLRTARSGLHKEGSKKVFGIPKPGKKRKFMEVSKHYLTDKSTNKTSVGNNEVKVAKVPISQDSGPRGWRNAKIDFRDKQPIDSKLRAFKTEKTSNLSAPQEGNVMARRTNLKASITLNENAPVKQPQASSGAFSKNEGTPGGHVVFSSSRAPSDASFKKVSTSSSTFERLSKAKLAAPGVKLGKIQEDRVYNSTVGKSVSVGGVEPRRSNRKIQPTSRMLEGLQTSLSIPNTKLQNRNTASSRGNNNG